MTPTEIIRRWKENPNAFASEELGFQPDRWQERFLSVFPSQDEDKKRISLQACTGPGKSAVLAVAVLNFITCYGGPGRHPRGYCTSITEDNLQDGLWAELANWYNRSEFLKRAFTWTKTRFSCNDHAETWFMAARTWSKRADAQAQGRTLSGLHAPYVMVVIDEAGDVPLPVLQGGEQIFSSEHRWAKLLMAGNPTSLEGALYHAAGPVRDRWYVIPITGDPDDPERASRVSIDNAREQIRLYGRDNPWVMATILGQFPPASINALLGIEDVEIAMGIRTDPQTGARRVLRPDVYEWSQKRLGVDVARFGNDRTVLFPRQGLQAFRPAIMRNVRTTDIAARVMAAKERWNWELCLLDDTFQWGHGVIDNLITAGVGGVHGVNYAGKSIDPRYKNKRAEMWMTGAKAIKEGGAALPNIPEMIGEMTAVTYSFVGGHFVLEDKDQVKAKLGRSPDLADAYMTTYALPEMPADVGNLLGIPALRRDQTARMDWDPFGAEEKSLSS